MFFWKILENKLSFSISYKLLILGDNNIRDNTLSVLTYLVYKKFIKDTETFTNQTLKYLIKSELLYKTRLFNMIDNTNEINIHLQEIINIL